MYSSIKRENSSFVSTASYDALAVSMPKSVLDKGLSIFLSFSEFRMSFAMCSCKLPSEATYFA